MQRNACGDIYTHVDVGAKSSFPLRSCFGLLSTKSGRYVAQYHGKRLYSQPSLLFTWLSQCSHHIHSHHRFFVPSLDCLCGLRCGEIPPPCGCSSNLMLISSGPHLSNLSWIKTPYHYSTTARVKLYCVLSQFRKWKSRVSLRSGHLARD